MRAIILIGLAMFFSGATFSDGIQASEIVKVRLKKDEAQKLKNIQRWIDRHLTIEDCPALRFFGVLSRDSQKTIVLGYQVIALCPDAPVPQVSLYFDSQQNYLENTRF